MKQSLTILILVLLCAGLSTAQQNNIAPEAPQTSSLGIQPASSAWSLIDLSRISWSHSYSVSYFSGNGYSGSAGLLNTTMFYDISPKLSLSLDLGILHNTGALFGNGEKNDATVLPGFQLDYHPSNNLHISLGVHKYQGWQTPYFGRSSLYRTYPTPSE